MKKMILSLSVVMMSSFANAAVYSCYVDYSGDDYTVEIETVQNNKLMVSFFDNDSWETLTLVSAGGPLCLGCPKTYVYKGTDLEVSFMMNSRIVSTPTRGVVTLKNGKKSKKYGMECKETDEAMSH